MEPDVSDYRVQSTHEIYKHLPGEATTESFQVACYFILAIELVERLCYYTFAGSQEFFLEELGFSPAQSAAINSAFSTLCYIWPLVGGYLADTYWGRYRTILVFAVAYLAGAIICSIAALPGPSRSSTTYLMGSMGLIALGTGGIKPNISNFGADQYDVSTEAGRQAQEAFYTQFYVMINVGALIAYGWLTTLCSNGAEPVIPQRFGYAAAYGIGSGAMTIAVIVFVCVRNSYKRKPPGGNALGGVVLHCWSATYQGSARALSLCIGWPALVLGLLCTVVVAISKSVATTVLAGGLVMLGLACVGWGSSGDGQWARRLAKKNSSITRNGTTDFLRVVPTLVAVSLAFNIMYSCMSFWFQQQACQMDLRVGSSFQLNGSFFNIADCMAIVVLTPFVLRFVNPFLARCLGKFDRHQKLLFGCALAALAVLWAAQLELVRRKSPVLDEASKCAPKGVRMSSLSGWWMIGPYAVMGIAEIYVNPTLYFLSYSQTPLRLRSTAQAVCLLTSAAASGLFTILANIMPSAQDLNETHLEYGYYASLLLAIPFLLCYLYVQRFFEEKTFDVEHILVELSEEEELPGSSFKEVAYQRMGFFRDFLSPNSRAGSPTYSPLSSPGDSPLLGPSSRFQGVGPQSYKGGESLDHIIWDISGDCTSAEGQVAREVA